MYNKDAILLSCSTGDILENSCMKIYTRVFFNISVSSGYSFSVGWNNSIATFPEKFRPSTKRRFIALIQREAYYSGDFEINTDGSCKLFATQDTSDQALYVSGSFEI